MSNKPNNWILPNRIGYNDKIFKTFKPENYQPTLKSSCDKTGDISNTSINLFPQQRLIKDYIQVDSPYRGLLLYHELGSGKSGASIAAAEGYLNKKKMFVLTPASLATNYENEILTLSSVGLNLKKDWSLVSLNKNNQKVVEILKNRYAITPTIIKKDGLVWIPLYENDIPNAIIIKSIVDETDKQSINLMISHIIRNRYTFISYNGLNNKMINNLGKTPFDNSFVIIDEVHNFSSRIVNGSKLAKNVYDKLMSAKDCKIILLSGTPIINNPYEIATIINLIRGYMNIYKIPYLSIEENITIDDINKQLEKDNLLSIIDEIYLDKKIFLSLLPTNYKKFKGSLIKKEDWGENEDPLPLIMESLNKIEGLELKMKYYVSNYNALPIIPNEFNEYFLDTTDDDNPKIKNQDLFMRRILGTVSYYSITGSELFPKVNDEIIRYLDMTNVQLTNYANVRVIERSMDAKKGGVLSDKSSVYRAFSRMVCNFSFPENIKREYPLDIKKAIKQEIDTEEENLKRIRRVGRPIPKISDVYERKLGIAVAELIEGDYLTYENVKNLYSPKFAAIYDDIETSPGSVLVYSQFRKVEGLGLLTEFLNKNGYIKIDLRKVEGDYELIDENVFDKKYDNRRYVIFDQDKKKTNILKNLFNGDLENLPIDIKKNLPEDTNQLYGKLVKLFCITASGAEGISLKNVRRVLITEPYWNNIRIEQVIGRAIRSCSHEKLPLKDRNVTVYKYIMRITEEQKKKNFTIMAQDDGKTTDEHISFIADKKKGIINKFLLMLKASSFDCIINAKQNKPLANGYKCYNWGLGINKDDLSYTIDINDDYKITSYKTRQILKKGKGRVVSKNGKKYVELNGKIYNYYSYINAGILIPEEI
jgi:hypothetical protein